MGLACAALIFFGFRPTYFQRDTGLPPLSPLLTVHALAFTAWVGLFVTQTALVSAGRGQWHKSLGLAGIVLALALVVLGSATALDALGRHAGPHAIDPFAFFAIPVTDIVVFAILAAAAIAHRRTPERHKRYMLMALIGLTAPALARIALHYGWPLWSMYPLVDVLVAGALCYDLATLKRISAASLWGAFAVAAKPIGYLIGPTPFWLMFAHALAP